MVGIAEVSAALGSLKTAGDMVRAVQGLTKDVEVKMAVADAMTALVDAQRSALQDQETIAALARRVRELETQVADLTGAKLDRDRYRLSRFPTGAMAYVLADHVEGEEPHRLCANCFDKGERSVLQTVQTWGGGETVACQRCSKSLILQEHKTDRRALASIGKRLA